MHQRVLRSCAHVTRPLVAREQLQHVLAHLRARALLPLAVEREEMIDEGSGMSSRPLA